MSLSGIDFWIALAQIIGINIVLSGDNAVVIALAARGLPQSQQRRAVAWGSGAAVLMRITLTIVAVELLRWPWLKLIGAGLLLWIAVRLLVPEKEAEGRAGTVSTLAAAVKTILLADLVMSLDNVIAVAAAAKGDLRLLIIGLAISIPVVVFASQVLLKLMDRYPVIITLGAALLGWVAGEMAIGDPAIRGWIDAEAAFLHVVMPAACAAGVVLLGRWLAPPPVRRVPAAAAAAARLPGRIQRLLLAVDGSPGASRAAEHLVTLRQQLAAAGEPQVHLVNVQRPVSAEVARFVAESNLEAYRRERSEAAFAPVRALLSAAGIAHQEHRLVGQPGQSISDLAHQLGADMIVMGTRGLGSHTAGLIGSVAQGTLACADVPVLMVK